MQFDCEDTIIVKIDKGYYVANIDRISAFGAIEVYLAFDGRLRTIGPACEYIGHVKSELLETGELKEIYYDKKKVASLVYLKKGYDKSSHFEVGDFVLFERNDGDFITGTVMDIDIPNKLEVDFGDDVQSVPLSMCSKL